MAAWPSPTATREEIAAFYAKHKPIEPEHEHEHEAPPMSNGPSPVCNACGKVRINIFAGPFCKTCQAQIHEATGEKA